MPNARYTDLQLDALRELANIGSGTAGTALSSLLGSPDRAVRAQRVGARAGRRGRGRRRARGPRVGRGRAGHRPGRRHGAARDRRRRRRARSARMLGVEADTDTGRSALGEIGNIMVSSYVGALGHHDRLRARPAPAAVHARHARRRGRQRPGRAQRRRTSWRSSSTPSSRSPARPARCPSCCCRRPRASPSCCTGSASVTDLSTATATDVVVRMGELAASASAGDVLVCVGLGSCIGLALVCRRGRPAGWRTSCCPTRAAATSTGPAKFAEHAVPALIARPRAARRARRLARRHPRRRRPDVQHAAPPWRSAPATRRRCAPARCAPAFPSRRPRPPASVGRTVRVHVATGTVTVREAGPRRFDGLR